MHFVLASNSPKESVNSMSDADSSKPEESPSPTGNRAPEPDVWEEEIDLREVGRGILDKWYIWIISPFLITVLTGTFFVISPDQYRVSGTLTIDSNQDELSELDVGLPPTDLLVESFRSTSELRPLLDKYRLLEDVENPEQYALNFSNEISIDTSISGTGPDRFDVLLETTTPDTIAALLNDRFKSFRSNQIRELKERLKERRENLQERQAYFENQWQEWRSQWNDLRGDSLPSLLKPQYQNALSRYKNSITNIESTREKFAELKSRKSSIEDMIENEPVTFSYQSPYLPFLGERDPVAGSKESKSGAIASEAINEAYQDLRKQRVNTNVSLSNVQQRIKNLQENINENQKEYLNIRRKLPPLEQRVAELKNRRSFIEENLSSLRSSIDTIDSLLNSMPQLIQIYEAESPGELVDSNGRRNTLLAGVVSFLLLFFGVAFWEIL